MGVKGGRRPAQETVKITALDDPVFQALLQETRLRILTILSSAEAHRRGGYSLQEIGALLDCSPQNAHHHLKILVEAGAVRQLRSEPTQRIPRQFWVSDVRRICLVAGDHAGRVEVEIEGVPVVDTTLDRRLREVSRASGMAGLRRLADIGIGTLLATLTYEEAGMFVRLLRERAEAGLER